MKQQPTLEQWDKLSDEHRLIFWGKDPKTPFEEYSNLPLPSIGQMIKFLGYKWQFIVCYHSSFGDIALRPDNLCDALWESVSYKLSTA